MKSNFQKYKENGRRYTLQEQRKIQFNPIAAKIGKIRTKLNTYYNQFPTVSHNFQISRQKQNHRRKKQQSNHNHKENQKSRIDLPSFGSNVGDKTIHGD